MKAVLDVYLQQNSYDNKILTKEANLCQKKKKMRMLVESKVANL